MGKFQLTTIILIKDVNFEILNLCFLVIPLLIYYQSQIPLKITNLVFHKIMTLIIFSWLNLIINKI